MQERSRKGTLTFALLAVLILAALPVGYYVFLRDPPPASPPVVVKPPPPPPVEPPKKNDALRISQVEGDVQVRKGQGEFVPATVGVTLEEQDAIRTSGGKARLSAENRYDVQVEPGSLVEVGELTEKISKFKLGLGMVVAKVEGSSGERLEVAAAQGDAVATTSDGTFAMSNNGFGTVAVGARGGEVEFKAAGKAVMLRGGQQSIAKSGKAPTPPAPIPSSLLLKVDWPKGKEVNKRSVTIAGQAAPGALVTIGGSSVKVRDNGKFKATVKLREGRNVINAYCVDLGGNVAEKQADFVVDTTAPDTNISTNELWK